MQVDQTSSSHFIGMPAVDGCVALKSPGVKKAKLYSQRNKKDLAAVAKQVQIPTQIPVFSLLSGILTMAHLAAWCAPLGFRFRSLALSGGFSFLLSSLGIILFLNSLANFPLGQQAFPGQEAATPRGCARSWDKTGPEDCSFLTFAFYQDGYSGLL